MKKCGIGILAVTSLMLMGGTVAVGCDAPVSGATSSKPGGPKSPKTPAGGDTDQGNTNVDGNDDAKSQPEAPKVDSITIDLGVVATGQTVTLDVPANAIGFNVTVQSSGEGTMGIEKVATPKGTLVHQDFAPTNSTSKNGEGHDGMGSVQIPSNDLPEAVKPAPGKWKITFGGAGSDAHAKARIQMTSAGAFQGGTLDLHLHFPLGVKVFDAQSATHIVDARSAQNDVEVKARVDAFYSGMKKLLGIDRGAVSFHDAPSEFAIINDDPTYYRATAISKGFPNDEHSLHILLANDLYNGEFLGYSPGIPGAVATTGTTMSGLVATFTDGEDANDDGFLWLHEMGHFIGLQHTTESDGATFDPLADTAQCPGTRGPNNPCGDDTNLMIPGAWPEGTTVPAISTSQVAIFRASPIYKPFGTAAAPAAGTTTTKPSSGNAKLVEDQLRTHRASITKSGRPLTATERLVGHMRCGSARQDPRVLIDAKGKDGALAELAQIANDADLPSSYRKKALRIADRIR